MFITSVEAATTSCVSYGRLSVIVWRCEWNMAQCELFRNNLT